MHNELQTACAALQKAAHRAAKNSAKGIGGIARHYGFNSATFQNKLNPGEPGCINLWELAAILHETRSTEMLDIVRRIAGADASAETPETP